MKTAQYFFASLFAASWLPLRAQTHASSVPGAPRLMVVHNAMVRKRTTKIVLRIAGISAAAFMAAFDCFATGSGIVWIPSTYVQPFTVVRFGIDNYFTVFKNGTGNGGFAYPTDIGLTMGVLPPSFPVGVEVGIDLMEPQNNPWSVNAKAGVAEDAFFHGSPALAAGVGSVGSMKDSTNYNIIYGVVSRIFPAVGRITAGYYRGNENLLRDRNGVAHHHGFLVGWDRAIPELSENLVLAVDYQAGIHAFGAFNIGATWNFTTDIGVMFGYNFYNGGYFPDTFTTQLDINI